MIPLQGRETYWLMDLVVGGCWEGASGDDVFDVFDVLDDAYDVMLSKVGRSFVHCFDPYGICTLNLSIVIVLDGNVESRGFDHRE